MDCLSEFACEAWGVLVGEPVLGAVECQGVASILVVILMIPHAFDYISTESLQHYAMILGSLAAAISLLSFLDYLKSNWNTIQDLLNREANTK